MILQHDKAPARKTKTVQDKVGILLYLFSLIRRRLSNENIYYFGTLYLKYLL